MKINNNLKDKNWKEEKQVGKIDRNLNALCIFVTLVSSCLTLNEKTKRKINCQMYGYVYMIF